MHLVLSNNQRSGWRFQPFWPHVDVDRAHVLSALSLSYHGYGHPHSEEEGEVLSVGDAALPHRQALAGREAGLCHHRLRRGGELLSAVAPVVSRTFFPARF